MRLARAMGGPARLLFEVRNDHRPPPYFSLLPPPPAFITCRPRPNPSCPASLVESNGLRRPRASLRCACGLARTPLVAGAHNFVEGADIPPRIALAGARPERLYGLCQPP